MTMRTLLFPGLLAVCIHASVFGATPENLIRNGSFEGGLLYWHDQKGKEIVMGGKVGEHALRINDGWTLSAPFVAERDATYTISLWARAVEGTGRVNVGMPPMAREVATRAKRIWTQGSSQEADLTTEWKRCSFTWKADVPRHGFWPLPHYGVTISKGKGAILVDGVTVVKGGEGTPDYVARRPVEVVAEATNLPGWDGPKGNMFEKGATATLNGYVSNPGKSTRNLTVRWQLMDYEGVAPHSSPIDTTLSLKAGQTVGVPVSLPLTATGTVIARCSALDADGAIIDSSDQPLTSLAYPKAATVPDYRERFGGSFAGGVGCLEKMQRIGFGWSRWWPKNKWHNFEPEKGKFNWQDAEFEEAFQRGISCHVVLYGWPEWIMDKEHPLPRDMRWKADDPRWEDLGVETAWDLYVKAAVEHFRGKPVVFQIANEPGHDKWGNFKAEYVKFNLRTARLIKKLDPKAKVSVNNVYLNPSPPNSALLKTGNLKGIDIWSWHDYHAGWLLDATGTKRLHAMLEGAGGGHMETWFTEGWAFTNTLVDQPSACTGLTSVESTHATMNCMAEMAANGHDKVVMFHLLYETHGQSFWDYSGPGTMLWDWYGNPLPTAGAWNVLNHHIGLSEEVGFIRPTGANLAVFRDLRNKRTVMIAYADRNSKADAVVELPFDGLRAEDIMGNPVPLDGRNLVLSRTERPVVLFTDKMAAKDLFAALEPLDRKHLGFVSSGSGGVKVYRLPDVWDGVTPGSAEGNPALSGGQPVWRVDRLYPKDRIMPGNYTPMIWGNQRWEAPDHKQGGHPSAQLKDGVLRLGTLGPWGGMEHNYRKQAALAFIVPENGVYRVRATAKSKPWGGSAASAYLFLMKRDEQRVGEIRKFALKSDGTEVSIDVEIDAAAGHEIVLLTEMPNHNNSTNVILSELTVTAK